MNNQVKLINKDQILKWLDDEFRNYPAEHMGNYGAGQDMLDRVATKIESGAFDFTPPVPTIKPGDKVRITDAMARHYIGKEDTVTHISGSAPYSARLKDSPGDWPFSSLEVVE